MFFKTQKESGFTLVELMVVVSIIGILAAVVYANFNEARAQSRDKARMVALKEAQLALEFYKAQYGRYPAQGCGAAGTFAGPGPAGTGFASCDDYMTGMVPEFLPQLPRDPSRETQSGVGMYYQTNAAGTAFKLMSYEAAEEIQIASYGDEFARCPRAAGQCSSTYWPNTYAVYSAGAELW